MEPRSTITFARTLRKEMTRSEVALWNVLRRKQFGGLKFRWQHVLGPYVVDFYCSALRLAIEVDGAAHQSEEAQAQDARRTRWMRAQDVRTVRAPNELVLTDMEAALRMISLHIPRALAGEQAG